MTTMYAFSSDDVYDILRKDESYNDYMTFFYENSLTKGDKMFLRSVTDKIAKPFSYSIDNVSLVMENLDIYDFEQEETLNFDLFEYL